MAKLKILIKTSIAWIFWFANSSIFVAIECHLWQAIIKNVFTPNFTLDFLATSYDTSAFSSKSNLQLSSKSNLQLPSKSNQQLSNKSKLQLSSKSSLQLSSKSNLQLSSAGSLYNLDVIQHESSSDKSKPTIIRATMVFYYNFSNLRCHQRHIFFAGFINTLWKLNNNYPQADVNAKSLF